MKKTILYILYCTSVFASVHAQTPVPAYTGTAYDPVGIIEFDSQMYFGARTATNGWELWSYAGVDTPVMVPNLSPAWSGALGFAFTRARMAVFQNKLYFAGLSANTGMEPCVYDGVSPPALLDIRPGMWSSMPFYFVTYGGRLYFTAMSKIDSNTYSLYSYNGTGSPVELRSLYQNNVADLWPYKGKIYFNATDSAQNSGLYAYDTLSNSLALAKYLSNSSSYVPINFIEVAGKLYFTTNEYNYGIELFSTDGSTVTRLTDIVPGGQNGIIYSDSYQSLAYYKNAI